MTLGPNLNPGLGSQASIPRGLALKPSRLGTPEPNRMTLLATQEDTVLLGAAGNTQSSRNLHTHLRPPSPRAPPSVKRSCRLRVRLAP